MVLQGISGPGTGLHTKIAEGSVISVGRKATCTLSIPTDRFISGLHLEITAFRGKLLLRDLGSSNGTFINGVRVQAAELRDRDSIRAGESTFQVQFDIPDPLSVIDVLSSQQEPLYAVLDAARDPAIYPMLLASGAYYWCLYTGQSARTLEAVAPYLVHLPPHCELLQNIVRQGWGKSWGIFLTSGQPPQTIWHELRRSLMVKLEEPEKWVYFRFYDPRVLRVFLPMTGAQQRAEFAGTMGAFLIEDEQPESILRFHSFPAGGALEKLEVTMSAASVAAPEAKPA